MCILPDALSRHTLELRLEPYLLSSTRKKKIKNKKSPVPIKCLTTAVTIIYSTDALSANEYRRYRRRC